MKHATHSPVPVRHVVVLGAGYAGLVAALRLARHTRVTLVAPSPHFTERVRQHELAAAGRDITHPLTGRGGLLNGTGVTHLAAAVTALDSAARTVRTDDGRRLPYDRLIYALGSRSACSDPHPGRAYTAESAPALHRHLAERPRAVTVVGGGLTGIEMAAEIAESDAGHHVRLITDGPLGPGLSARGRDHVRAVLAARRVGLEEGRRVGHADDIDADAVVWATAAVPRTDIAARAGLLLAPSGRIAVDQALRSLSHPEVYAAGDAAAAHSPAAGPLRMACATALPTGVAAADSILAELRGHEPRPLAFTHVLQCISLGRHDGLIQFVRPDDSPRGVVLTGHSAARVKEQVIRTTIRFLRLAARTPSAVRLVPLLGR